MDLQQTLCWLKNAYGHRQDSRQGQDAGNTPGTQTEQEWEPTVELWEDKTDKCVLYNTHKSENVKAGVQI
jgi:hypothetical protein